MKRIAEWVWLVALTLWLLACGGARVDALKAALATNNAMVDTLTEAKASADADLRQALLEKATRCPPPSNPGRAACLETGRVEVLAQFDGRYSRLQALALAQRGAARELTRAQECRAAGQPCEGGAVDTASRILEGLAADLGALEPRAQKPRQGQGGAKGGMKDGR